MKSQRGTVTKIHFEIEYPDGSKKVRVFDGSDGVDVGSIQAIVFDDKFVHDDDASNFTVSHDDWTQNPTMGIYLASDDDTKVKSMWPCQARAHLTASQRRWGVLN